MALTCNRCQMGTGQRPVPHRPQGLKSNGDVASIWLKIGLVDDAVGWVTVRPVIESRLALPLPPTSATGTVSVITPGLAVVKLPVMLVCAGDK